MVRDGTGIQVLLGILHIVCGAFLVSFIPEFLRMLTARSYYGIWGGILLLLSGSSCMVAEKKRRVQVVNGCLALNVTSLLASAVGVIMVLWDLSFQHDRFFRPQPELHMMQALLGVLLTFVVLETCITLFSIYFGWKTRLVASAPGILAGGFVPGQAAVFTPSFVPPPATLPPPPPYHEVFVAVDRRAL